MKNNSMLLKYKNVSENIQNCIETKSDNMHHFVYVHEILS